MPCCSVLQLDGRRAPVIDLLATSTQPKNNDNVSAETIYTPSTKLELEGGISGSPPAILDNWFQLQHAVSLESVNNGNTALSLETRNMFYGMRIYPMLLHPMIYVQVAMYSIILLTV